MYGFTVMAWLVFATKNLDQQPTYIAFASMESCYAAKKVLDEEYRYPIICVPSGVSK